MSVTDIMKKALKYILPVAMTVLLVWLLFRKVNFAQTMQLMRHGVRYEWILAGIDRKSVV